MISGEMMEKRKELIPLIIGVLIMTYLVEKIPSDKVLYVLPYGLLTLAGIKRRAFPYATAALFSGSFIEWVLTRDYLALAGIAVAILAMPVRVEKQQVRMWERVINTAVAGTVAYVSVVGQDIGIKVAGIFAAIAMLSGNRGISSGGILVGSSIFMAIPLGNLSDMEPMFFIGASIILLVYSLHHLRKLLR
ncbi:hypothetical protein [Thermococcus gorgonarius]|uniref:Uncharacterized protein n=1 Tax=Thermococcus gorgonarius TaxID=71997 RepID=A0A2Z2MBQ6_THEGO|nr:hypothetical protein [Thermococcus gorgonarius]ASJ01364.1 hypothetical protein A3K92_07650 [Thermococcus gorgonarius]